MSGQNTNLSYKGLNNLYNEKVISYQEVSRPMASSGGMNIPVFSHQGVVLTTESGGKYLVHNGHKYGKDSDTVITDAKNMGSSWKYQKTHSVSNGKTVGQITREQINKGHYNLVNNNCYHSQSNIKRQSSK